MNEVNLKDKVVSYWNKEACGTSVTSAQKFSKDYFEEAITHVKNRLNLYGLSAEEVRVADAESLPYTDKFFDLVYSWGVIHHSPDTLRALEEIIRCTKIGGLIKLMIYNRRSLSVLYKYFRFALLKGNPFRTFSDILYHHQESIGTKAFTISEIKNIISKYPVEIKSINAKVTHYDLLRNQPLVFRFTAYVLACLFGFNKCGWFMTIELKKNL